MFVDWFVCWFVLLLIRLFGNLFASSFPLLFVESLVCVFVLVRSLAFLFARFAFLRLFVCLLLSCSLDCLLFVSSLVCLIVRS